MAKNIVICCDGTGNQVEGNLSNVLKLFQIVDKDFDAARPLPAGHRNDRYRRCMDAAETGYKSGF